MELPTSLDIYPLRSAVELGALIRSVRKTQGTAQEVLAKKAHMTRRGLQEIEYGESLPSLPTISALAAALGLRMDSLVRQLPPCRRGDGCGGGVVLSLESEPVCLLCGSRKPWDRGNDTGFPSASALFGAMVRSAKQISSPGGGSRSGRKRGKPLPKKKPTPTTLF